MTGFATSPAIHRAKFAEVLAGSVAKRSFCHSRKALRELSSLEFAP